jgi:hypothetical protein
VSDDDRMGLDKRMELDKLIERILVTEKTLTTLRQELKLISTSLGLWAGGTGIGIGTGTGTGTDIGTSLTKEDKEVVVAKDTWLQELKNIDLNYSSICGELEKYAKSNFGFQSEVVEKMLGDVDQEYEADAEIAYLRGHIAKAQASGIPKDISDLNDKYDINIRCFVYWRSFWQLRARAKLLLIQVDKLCAKYRVFESEFMHIEAKSYLEIVMSNCRNFIILKSKLEAQCPCYISALRINTVPSIVNVRPDEWLLLIECCIELRSLSVTYSGQWLSTRFPIDQITSQMYISGVVDSSGKFRTDKKRKLTKLTKVDHE